MWVKSRTIVRAEPRIVPRWCFDSVFGSFSLSTACAVPRLKSDGVANRQETRNAQQKNLLDDDEVLTTHLKNYLAALCARFVCAIKISITISQRTKASPDYMSTAGRLIGSLVEIPHYLKRIRRLCRLHKAEIASSGWLNSTAQRSSKKLQLNGLFYFQKVSVTLFIFIFIKLDFLSLCLLSTSFRLSFPILELRPLPNWTVRRAHITTTTTKKIHHRRYSLSHCTGTAIYQAQHTYIHTMKMWELK